MSTPFAVYLVDLDKKYGTDFVKSYYVFIFLKLRLHVDYPWANTDLGTMFF